MCRSEDQNDVVHALKDLGIKCQIDDFGTGFSSLSNLAHLTVDGLKIDRSFIMQLSEHQKNTKIIRAIVTLAKNLGISVTAEGIETDEQLDLVTALGCEEAQGYLFSPPLTQEAFEAQYLVS